MATFKQLMNLAKITVDDKTSGKRAREILHIIKKDKVLHGMDPQKAVRFLEDLGPTYVKIGQLASNRADILPADYCEAFANLRSHVDPMPFATVLECIDQDYGQPWNRVFASIQEKPLGSASIAQVHKATLLDGTVVAVKVRRPGIKEEMAEDLTLLRHLLAIAEVGAPANASVMESLQGLLNELERTTECELDFTIELNNLVRFREQLKDAEGITSPRPFPEYSSEAILVEEFISGTDISNHVALIAQGNDLTELANRLAQNYISQVIDEGFFHADPHEGNIIVRGREIEWIDLGMVGSLNSSQRLLVNRALSAIAEGDAFELKEAVMGLTVSKGDVNHGKLLQQMQELLDSYGSADLADIDIGKALMDIIEILRSQNLAVNSSFTMMARGFITIEGVVTRLSPDANIIEIVQQHMERKALSLESIMQKTKQMTLQAAHSAESATKLPTQLSHTLDMLNEGEINMGMSMDLPKDVKATAYSLTGHLSFALISAGMFIGSSILCTTNLQPHFLGAPLLGVIGFVSAFILGAYVVWQMIMARHKTRNDEEIK
ncbi:ABC1 kinase family protein [Anaerotardibacter muris]|uniref:ABC1 kinase family protein n=1 Tax=Anaerotardibacter muris TaxID=2941505 RepID=UPI00203EED41|nr:AarF/UbiB family protein [Anaerotardibacter muris]